MQKSKGGVVVTGVAFERKLLKRLDAVAAREERSRSWVVRRAIARELARSEAADR